MNAIYRYAVNWKLASIQSAVTFVSVILDTQETITAVRISTSANQMFVEPMQTVQTQKGHTHALVMTDTSKRTTNVSTLMSA